MLFAPKCTVLLNVAETNLLGTLLCGAQGILNTMQDQCSQLTANSLVVLILATLPAFQEKSLSLLKHFFSQKYSVALLLKKKISTFINLLQYWLDVMAHTINPRTWEAEAGESLFPGQSDLQSEFHNSQGCYREKPFLEIANSPNKQIKDQNHKKLYYCLHIY